VSDPVQNLAAETENRAIAEAQAATFNAARKGHPVAVLPGGRRVDASPFVNARYNLNDSSTLLGAPETIVGEDFKREHPGWHYAWPVRMSNVTASYLRAQWYKPVPFDAIDKNNPLAQIAELPTPAGNQTVWMQHLLVAIPPEAWHQLVDNNVEHAIARTAMNRQDIEEQINSQFGKGGYKGQVDAFVDQRRSKTGD
jgi:hypothetical protein